MLCPDCKREQPAELQEIDARGVGRDVRRMRVTVCAPHPCRCLDCGQLVPSDCAPHRCRSRPLPDDPRPRPTASGTPAAPA